MEYIQEMRNVLHDLEARIQKTKLNVENINQLMQVGDRFFQALLKITFLVYIKSLSSPGIVFPKGNKSASFRSFFLTGMVSQSSI